VYKTYSKRVDLVDGGKRLPGRMLFPKNKNKNIATIIQEYKNTRIQ